MLRISLIELSEIDTLSLVWFSSLKRAGSTPSAFLHSLELYPLSPMLRDGWCVANTTLSHILDRVAFGTDSLLHNARRHCTEARHSCWTTLSRAMLPSRFLQHRCTRLVCEPSAPGSDPWWLARAPPGRQRERGTLASPGAADGLPKGKQQLPAL